MKMLNMLKNEEAALAVVGLGYVGLPLAAAFAEHFKVIGFDNSQAKIAQYHQGIDPTDEIGNKAVAESSMLFTCDETKLREALFIIVAVPTPVNGDKTPDLKPVKNAARIVGRNLQKGTIIVFESTVYPGVTEEICLPILEKYSGLVCGRDFKIGYSPERINPGDKVHRLKKITKLVSGMDECSLQEIAEIYEQIIEAGVHRVSSIKVAEAAKLVENSQRDINIAFMNELAMVFDRMGINTKEVVEAMDTKWNSLGFKPGLVGGHCIGVDPYYFIYQAELLGYHSQIIAAGRRINDSMSEFVAQTVIKEIIKAGIDCAAAKIYLMGMTFKENCPDTRNSRAIDVYNYLTEYGLRLQAVDTVADKVLFAREFGISFCPLEEVRDADCLVFLVAHDEFKALSAIQLKRMYKTTGRGVIIDVKSIYDKKMLEQQNIIYWNL